MWQSRYHFCGMKNENTSFDQREPNRQVEVVTQIHCVKNNYWYTILYFTITFFLQENISANSQFYSQFSHVTLNTQHTAPTLPLLTTPFRRPPTDTIASEKQPPHTHTQMHTGSGICPLSKCSFTRKSPRGLTKQRRTYRPRLRSLTIRPTFDSSQFFSTKCKSKLVIFLFHRQSKRYATNTFTIARSLR